MSNPLLHKIGRDPDPMKTYVTKEEKERLRTSCYVMRGGIRCDKGKGHTGEHHFPGEA